VTDEREEPAPSTPDPPGATEPTAQTARPGQAAPPTYGSGSMYGWLWRRLPGSRPAKVAILVVAAAVVVVLLFAVVFPWVEPRLPFNQVTVGG
jgi:hypothetical protein